MTKQEEVRQEIIATINFKGVLDTVESLTDKILRNLKSKGVVIKSNREVPLWITYSKEAPVTIEQTLITPKIKRMIKALNLVAVEELIEEHREEGITRSIQG